MASAKPVSIEEVIYSTRTRHPLIVEALQNARAADGRALRGLGIFDPTLEAKGDFFPHGDFEIGKGTVAATQQTGIWGLSLTGAWTIGRGDFPVYKKNSATSSGGQATLGLELPLLRGGPIDSGRAKLWTSRYKRDAARFGVTLTKLEVQRQAAHAYWNWVAMGRRLSIATNLMKIAETRMAQISGRVQGGDLPEIEEIDNQRAILNRNGVVVKARRGFEKAALKLSLFFRDTKGRPVVAKREQLPASIPLSPLPAENLAVDIRYALKKRPELWMLSAKRAATEVARRLARNEHLPTVNVMARGGYDIGPESYESRRTEVLLGIKFKLPTLLRKARGSLQIARGTLGSIDAKARLTADKIVMQVRDSYSALKAVKESLAIAERELKVAHRVEEAERERFRLGATTLLTVNLREQAAAEARVRAIDAAAALRRALADYQAVTARGISGE